MPKKKSDSKEKKNKEDIFKPVKFGEYSFYEELLEEENEKEYEKFVKDIERAIRRSIEMKDYIRFLRDEVNLHNCYFLSGVSADDVDIEFHHHPFTLFDITQIACDLLLKNNKEEQEVSSLATAQKVVEWHYDGMVGLVPLSKTVHELAHAKQIIIPPSAIFGVTL